MRKLAPLGDALHGLAPGISALKQAMSLLGLCDAHVVRPRRPMNSEGTHALARVMKDLGLI